MAAFPIGQSNFNHHPGAVNRHPGARNQHPGAYNRHSGASRNLALRGETVHHPTTGKTCPPPSVAIYNPAPICYPARNRRGPNRDNPQVT